MNETARPRPLPRPVMLLGLAGVVPQALCLAIVLLSAEWRWVALAAGCFYAAAILSFLGGLWWMRALLADQRGWPPYLAAVAASLGAWAALLPWALGWHWPGPALALLGTAILASPLVDLWLARSMTLPAGWLARRWQMASGLGVLTLVLSALSPA